MIPQSEFHQRRERLMEMFTPGRNLLFHSGQETFRKPDTPNPFSANTHFFYFTGYDRPNSALLLMPGSGETHFFAPEPTTLSQTWTGAKPSLAEIRERHGFTHVHDIGQLESYAQGALALPSANAEELARASIELRLIKSAAEVEEINTAVGFAEALHKEILSKARVGMYESDLRAEAGIFHERTGSRPAFPLIVTKDGWILHQDDITVNNRLKSGDLVVFDAGVEIPSNYVSDLTTTFPVNGTYTNLQREVYGAVIAASDVGINGMQPGSNYRDDVHIAGARSIAGSLKDMGVLKGSVDDLVESGTVYLFFMHGIGHHLGLDTHDCGDYPDITRACGPGNPRSDLFGLHMLRYAGEVKPGMVMTIEPGIYINPFVLADDELLSKYPRGMIDFDKARQIGKEVPGIRYEVNVHVTPSGPVVLGDISRPKTAAEVENAMLTSML